MRFMWVGKVTDAVAAMAGGEELAERGEHGRSHRDEEFGEDATEVADSSERRTGCSGEL
jgi:hypothetical protein